MITDVNATTDGEWIDKNLYWRGSSPPVEDIGFDQWIRIPHEHFIPVSKARLVHSIKALYSEKKSIS